MTDASHTRAFLKPAHGTARGAERRDRVPGRTRERDGENTFHTHRSHSTRAFSPFRVQGWLASKPPEAVVGGLLEASFAARPELNAHDGVSQLDDPRGFSRGVAGFLVGPCAAGP